MDRFIKLATILALSCGTYASVDHISHSQLPPSPTYGVPLENSFLGSHLADIGLTSQQIAIGNAPSTSYGTPIPERDLDLVPPPLEQSTNVDNTGILYPGSESLLNGLGTNVFNGPVSSVPLTNLPLDPNISTGYNTLQQGTPISSASKYELHSVVQNIIRRIPVEVVRHVKIPVPQPVAVPGEHIKVPVPHPVPVPVEVVKHVPYPVYKTQHIEVERHVPVPVVKHVPVEVIKEVPIPVERPVEVIKHVHVPVDKHVEVHVPVWKPYPIHIIKHVTHYKKW